MTHRLGLLAVHPHPDDETIGAGGVLARYTSEGLRTMVVTCTDGAAGKVFADVDLTDGLPTVRARELSAALDALGVADHEWLGYRDSGMLGWPENDHPEAFVNTAVDEAARRLVSIIRRFRPHVVVGDDRNGTYGHPDHVRAHVVTSRALDLAADDSCDDDSPPWRVPKRYAQVLPRGSGPATDVPATDVPATDVEATASVDVSRWADAKLTALRAHVSQFGPGGLLYEFTSGGRRDLLASEHFLRLDPLPHGGFEDDLFAGLR